MNMCEVLKANRLIEKLPNFWDDYRNRLKDKGATLSSESMKLNLVESSSGDKHKSMNWQRKPNWQTRTIAPFKKSGQGQRGIKGG
ncbi:hypothetical protein LINPERPRIM_LOCUS29559 [Linum perenne]